MKVGRAFFWPPKATAKNLSCAAYQPLENHRDNIIKFAKEWEKKGDKELPGGQLPSEVWQWIHQAAEKHDRGKADTFKVTEKERTGELEYSFRGHRFRTPEGMTLFAELVEQGHHDYSTPEITKTAARIRREGTEEEQKFHRCFPEALYVLSMCDQIEAETAVRAFYGKSESRAFLDFVLYAENRQDAPLPFGERATFYLDPFPFREAITNRVEYWLWENPPQSVEQLTKSGRGEERPTHLLLRTVEVTICPLT